jgi:hypothetical protein
MGARKLACNHRVAEHPEVRAAGWHELHAALQSGVPHAMEIVVALDAHGFSYPWSPAYCAEMAELRCYRVVHKAWREGLLARFLTVLGAWRMPESQLSEMARLPELQLALCDFLQAHREINPQALRFCLGEQSLLEMIPEREAATVENIRRRIEAAWSSHVN